MDTIITRGAVEVIIGPTRPTVIIGERINPTGKDWLKKAIREGDFARVATLAQEQVAAGAHIIDVNVMVDGIAEVDLLPRAVESIQEAVDVPLCLDSSNVEALRAALPVCDGKVIVNSVNGDPERLETVLPLVYNYKAAVIGLAMSKASGIPNVAEERVQIAARILEAVRAENMPVSDLIIDCLTLAVGAEPSGGQVGVETIRRVSHDLGLNVIMGVSNVSFGLPERPIFNAAFVAMAVAAGMTCALINPLSKPVLEVLLAADVLLGRDRQAQNFLKYYRARKKATQRHTY